MNRLKTTAWRERREEGPHLQLLSLLFDSVGGGGVVQGGHSDSGKKKGKKSTTTKKQNSALMMTSMFHCFSVTGAHTHSKEVMLTLPGVLPRQTHTQCLINTSSREKKNHFALRSAGRLQRVAPGRSQSPSRPPPSPKPTNHTVNTLPPLPPSPPMA